MPPRVTEVHAQRGEHIKVTRDPAAPSSSRGIASLIVAATVLLIVVRIVSWVIETLGMLGGILSFAAMTATLGAACFFAFGAIRWDVRRRRWMKIAIVAASTVTLLLFAFGYLRPTMVRALADWIEVGGAVMPRTPRAKAALAFVAFWISTPLPVYGLLSFLCELISSRRTA